MITDALLRKLFEIEWAIGVEDSSTIRSMVIDAQDRVLQMQWDLKRSLRRPQTSHQGGSRAFLTVGAERIGNHRDLRFDFSLAPDAS